MEAKGLRGNEVGEENLGEIRERGKRLLIGRRI